MKKFAFVFALIMILAIPLNSLAYGWLWGVGQLPEFPVTVNGQEYNYNEYETFPLLVNGGVTYFPLTYNNAMILNLIPEYCENPLSIRYTKGNPDEPKQIFKKHLIKKVENLLMPRRYTGIPTTIRHISLRQKKTNLYIIFTRQ